MLRTMTSQCIVTLILILVASHLQAATVTLSAGSSDQLAAAIAEAGAGGKVVLAAGVHHESGTVAVDAAVAIVGEEGAVLEVATTANLTFPITVTPAFHITGAGARVQNLAIRAPEGTKGSCAILIEDAAGVQVMDNRITGHHVGILIQRGDRARIEGNTLQIASDEPGTLPENGVVVINGAHVQIQDNWVTGATMGIFLSGSHGDASGNATEGCIFGMILCTPSNVYEIGGEVAIAEKPANGWIVYQNTSVGNAWGYLVIDGSHHNILTNNAAALNSMYDLELAADSERFGIFTPTSHDNIVVQGLNSKGLKVKDCGTNNHIHGHINKVDKGEDPCF